MRLGVARHHAADIVLGCRPGPGRRALPLAVANRVGPVIARQIP